MRIWIQQRRKKRALTILCLLALLGHLLVAGTTGKIRGTVKDKKTGESMIGVNIVVQGTTMGAASDVDGNYTILNIAPGEYTLVASMMGYSQTRINGVRVQIDLSANIDIEMTETVVQLGSEVVITALRPLVQKDQTASTAVVGGEQLASLPVTEFSQALNLQAGFVAGSLRGGRRGEVAYWIDGVPVTDVYDGSQVVEVNKNLIQEAQIVSGSFNAEYGQAMSGIVNIATREGGSQYKGTAGVYFGDFLSSRPGDFFKADTGLFPGIDNINPVAIRNFEASLSGPLLGDELSFFANGRYIYYDGYLSGFRRFNPQNISYFDSLNVFHLYRDSSGKGDSARVPMDWSERYYAQGKLTWKISGEMKLNVNYIFDKTDSKGSNQAYFYNPDGTGTNHNESQTIIAQLSHNFSSEAFYTIGLSYFNKNYQYYLYSDPHDQGYVHPNLSQTPNSYSALTGGTDLGRFERNTITALAKFDLSWQMDQQNLWKAGAEVRRHKLYYNQFTLQPVDSQNQNFVKATSSPYINTMIPDISTINHNEYTHQPYELSAYIQNKMEFKDIIVNIGVRVDYFEPDGHVLVDETDPNIYNPIGDNYRAMTLDQRKEVWYKKASAKVQVSPRFGASFPITDAGVVHISYGYFFQTPRLERLYENPDFKISQRTGNQGIVGNTDLKPEQTIKGEIGLQQGIGEEISVDVTAYIQDIRNLTSTRGAEIILAGGQGSYSKYVNNDFGFIKGVALSFDKRFSGGFTASVFYTFQVARGSASDPAAARNAIAGGALPEVQMTALDWDQRHTLNTTLSYNTANYGMSLIGQYGTGTPYTPSRIKPTGSTSATDITSIATNAEIKPTFFNLDARAFLEVSISSVKAVLFVRAFNLLDIRNELGVWDDTGRAGFTLYEEIAAKSNPVEYVNTLQQAFLRPTNFSDPRRVEIGMNLEF
jgi:outer membrane receptor for ferrienterochelin and colicin